MPRPSKDGPLFRRYLPALLAVLGLCACNHPPVREVTAAEALLERARAEGAPTFAPERWREAEDALKTAKDKLEEKDYRGAISSATEAAERSRAAVEAAGARKTAAREAVEKDRSEVEAVLAEVASLWEEAARAKVPETAFTEVTGAVESVAQGRQGIESDLQQGDLLGAERAADQLKTRASPLPTAFRQARVRWEAAHARGGRRKR